MSDQSGSSHVDASAQNFPSLNDPESSRERDLAATNIAATTTTTATNTNANTNADITIADSSFPFTTLPLEIREIIWKFALPPPRVFNVLVWVSAGLKMQVLNRSELKVSLASTCFEARRIVKEAGYRLAFRDEDQVDDPGIWFHPQKDKIERTIWGPGDWSMAA
ncbi:hypothetical protein GGR51DRAFT_524988 [Nemania sp. FL0031]|nr:hypothetical protein GGR51DRAFT_524988 [Nemania sp. FL0031]